MTFPIAPHREVYEHEVEYYNFWVFHRTETSMQDFLSFVKFESTQVKTETDFHMDFPYNRSAKAGNLIPEAELVKFEPG